MHTCMLSTKDIYGSVSVGTSLACESHNVWTNRTKSDTAITLVHFPLVPSSVCTKTHPTQGSVALSTLTVRCNHHPPPECAHLPRWKFHTRELTTALPIVPGTHPPSTVCLSESACSRDLRQVESDSICPFVTGLLHSA